MESNNQPVNNEQPAVQGQPPIMQAVAPRKKKTGLIIGIVSGSLAVILLIAGILTYFLWWQNPQKIVTDAVAKTISTKKAITNGKIKFNTRGVNLELDIKGVADSPKSKSDINLKVKIDNIEESFSQKASLMYDEAGTLYIKLENVKETISSFLKTMARANLPKNSTNAASDKQIEEMQRALMSQIESKINSDIEGKWLRLSMEDVAGKEAKCQAELMSKFSGDPKLKDELSKLYQKNSFLVVGKAKVEDRNGGRGFEVSIDENKLENYQDSVANNATISDVLGSCKPMDYKKGTGHSKISKSMIDDVKLKIWADGGHNMKAMEVKIDAPKSKGSFSMSFDINPNKTEPIEIPSDAKNLKKVFEDIMKTTSLDGYSAIGDDDKPL